MSHSGTDDRPGRHVASSLRGLRLGITALLFSLVLPSWYLTALLLFGPQSESVTLSGDPAIYFLLWGLVGYLGLALALGFGVWAIRKNRALGKILGILGMLISVAIITLHVLAVFYTQGYLGSWFGL